MLLEIVGTMGTMGTAHRKPAILSHSCVPVLDLKVGTKFWKMGTNSNFVRNFIKIIKIILPFNIKNSNWLPTWDDSYWSVVPIFLMFYQSLRISPPGKRLWWVSGIANDPFKRALDNIHPVFPFRNAPPDLWICAWAFIGDKPALVLHYFPVQIF